MRHLAASPNVLKKSVKHRTAYVPARHVPASYDFARRGNRGKMPRLRLLLPVAVLERRAAAAWAGVVAADAFAAIADRLDRFVGRWRSGGIAGTRRIAIAAGCGFVGRRFVVCRGRDLPQRTYEVRAFPLEPEDRTGDLLGDAGPHSFEGFHSLALVFYLGV